MSRATIIQVVSFVIYLFFQVVIFKNAVLFSSAFCFLYIAFLLLLPVETGALVLMFAGFGMGLFVDMFYDSAGTHAFACVLIMYLRNVWLARVTPQGGYDNGAVPGIVLGGVQWFVVYTLPLVFIHHTVLFFMEAGGFQHFWFTVMKVFFSTIYTMVMILIVQYVFPGSRRI